MTDIQKCKGNKMNLFKNFNFFTKEKKETHEEMIQRKIKEYDILINSPNARECEFTIWIVRPKKFGPVHRFMVIVQSNESIYDPDYDYIHIIGKFKTKINNGFE